MKQQSHTKGPVHTEFSAGGIVFRRTEHGPEIAFISDSTKKWTFPKGHIDRGESVERAAARESEEEMGLRNLRILRRLGKIDIWFIDRFVHKGALIHKYIYYVLLQAPRGARLKTPPRPKRGEPIFSVRWVPIEQALKLSSYKDVRPVLEKAIAMLKRRQNV